MDIQYWTIVLKDYFFIHSALVDDSVDKPNELYVLVDLPKVVHSLSVAS